MTLDMPARGKRLPGAASPPRTPARPLPRRLSRQIARFDVAVRPAIRCLVREVPRAADLVDVFPALLYALASGHGSQTGRRRALELIDAGGPLKSVARHLEVPMWLRRLPPETFRGPLHAIPDSDGFSRRIVQRLPVRTAMAAAWLEAVCFAERAGTSEFALWIARQRPACFADRPEHRLCLLAAYAWFSQRADTAAGRLIWSRWRPEVSLDTAVCAAKSWFNRIVLTVQLPDGSVLDPWLQPGSAGGFDIVPLIDSTGLLEEAGAMNNCADQYARQLVTDRCRLFSVRHKGAHVATLEMAPHQRERRALAVAQLKGRHNMPAPLEVWQAVYQWLAGQQALIRPLPSLLRPTTSDQAIWQHLMAPYRAATGGAPWIPDQLAPDQIEQLDGGLARLADACEIRSWLFA